MSKNGHVRGSRTEQINAILAKAPDTPTATIAEKVGVNYTYVNRIKKKLQCINPLHKLVSKRSTMQLALDVGAMDTEVKLLNNSRVVGTIVISENGISYKKANAKKGTGRSVSYPTLERLMQLGLV